MASTSQAFMTSFFFFLVISLAVQMVAGRNIPTNAKLQPEGHGRDRSVLIPGLGRVMVPKKGDNPLNYNPITGTPGGHGVSIPRVGGSTGGASRRSNVPGGDVTVLPNLGVEVPNPAGGGTQAPSRGCVCSAFLVQY